MGGRKRTRRSGSMVPSARGRAARPRPRPGLVDTQGGKAGADGQQPRSQEHGPHVPDPHDAAHQGADRHAGELAAVDGGEGAAPPLDAHRARDHGQRGHRRRSGAHALERPQGDGERGGDGEEEREAGDAVHHQAGEQHRPAPDPVGELADGVLGEHAGGIEGGHHHAGQGVRAAQVADVHRQHGDDRGGAHPLEEGGDAEGADQPARGVRPLAGAPGRWRWS